MALQNKLKFIFGKLLQILETIQLIDDICGSYLKLQADFLLSKTLTFGSGTQ